jgi:hypothetical protein
MLLEGLEKTKSTTKITISLNQQELVDIFNAMYRDKKFFDNDGKSPYTPSASSLETFANISFVKDVVFRGKLDEYTLQLLDEIQSKKNQ